MRIWLITVGEPLPVGGTERLLRTGTLANLLAGNGHEVTWWTSTFDHFRKRFHAAPERNVEIRAGLRLRFLHGRRYDSNVGIARLVNHWQIARDFSRRAAGEAPPNVILCSFPTIELSVEAVRYGRRARVPVVLDIRDFWPDVFLETAPPALRPLGRLALQPLFGAAREACANATAIIGITPEFVAWGLRRGSRTATPLDRDFPHGYVDETPPAAAIEDARRSWQARGLHESDFIACFFGTLGRQFALETVLLAAERLHAECPDLKFVICGDGDRLAHYRNLAARLPGVQLPGWVQFAEIWTLMRMAAVGLAPYINEASFTQSIPNKAIEYLSASLPVVSSLGGVLDGLLTRYNCGFMYAEDDAEEFVRIMRLLYRDRTVLKASSARAGTLYRERFVASSVYGQLAEHLQQVVRTRGDGQA